MIGWLMNAWRDWGKPVGCNVVQSLLVTLIVVKHYTWLIIFVFHMIIIVFLFVGWERSVSKVTC